ncbi:MAG: VanZ family protein [Bacilli bacterium]|jgi:VanZ family protein
MRKRYQQVFLLINIIIFCLATFLIIRFSFSSGSESSTQSGFFSSLFIAVHEFIIQRNLNAYEISVTNFEIRKLIGHFLLFAVDGLSLFSVCHYFFPKRKSLLIALTFGILLAVSSEFIQMFQVSRSPQLYDVILDFSGFFLSSILVFLLTKQDKKLKK